MRGDAVTPISMEIDLTNVCNYRCPNCVWEQVLSQVHQCAGAGVKAVIFSGGGEPLAHPAALDCIDYFQAKRDLEMISEEAYAQWWSVEVVPRLVELEQRYAGAEFAIHYTKVNYSIRLRSLRCHIHRLATAINAEAQYIPFPDLLLRPGKFADRAEDPIGQALLHHHAELPRCWKAK
jgi:hypothetical protein